MLKQLKADLEQSEVKVSTHTTHHRLNQEELHGRRPRRTERLLKERYKKERLIFAKEYLDKPQSSLPNVLWTDESKIKLFVTHTSSLFIDDEMKLIR